MSDQKHLTLRGSTWYLNYRVPNSLHESIGKTNIQKSLRTDSLKNARRLRDKFLREFDEKLNDLEVNPNGVRLRNLVTEIRAKFKSIRSQEEFEGFHGYYDAESEYNKGNRLMAAAIVMAQNEEETDQLNGYDTRHTLKEASNRYVRYIQDKVSIHTIRNTKRAVRNFLDHRTSSDLILEEITRPQIVKFIDHLAQDLKLTSKSINTLLSSLNQIWEYSFDRGHVRGNSPFKGHKTKIPHEKTNSKKPFDLDQWSVLTTELELSASTYARKWIGPIGLMTGMRINEIAGLLKEDVYKESNGEWFFSLHEDERRLKNKGSIRKIPIHSSIKDAVLKLKADSPNKFLLPEVITNPTRRATTIGGWFSRIKTKHVSKDSVYCFHSLRGMLATAFENAGIELGIASAIIGHKRSDLTYGLYSNGLKPEILCNAIDKASLELEGFIKLFPKD